MPIQSELHDRVAHVSAGSMHRPERTPVAIGIIALTALAAYSASSFSPSNQANHSRQTRSAFTLNLANRFHVDSKLIRFEQQATIPIQLDNARAIASAADGRILVAGDTAIHVLDADGQRLHVINLADMPLCMAIDNANLRDTEINDAVTTSELLYVATSKGIEVWNSRFEPVASWRLPRDNSLITSIAVADGRVFAADAANRIVWQFDTAGKLLRQIGGPDPDRNIPGFVIPSAQFDIAASPEGLLYCVNPGKQQIAAFTFEGDLGTSWGRAGSSISSFFGCCNPAHIALTNEGRFITSEKGIPRIKVYGPTGRFESVVAGPEQLGISEQSMSDPRLSTHSLVFDVAVDPNGRVLVLDARNECVRVFVETDI